MSADGSGGRVLPARSGDPARVGPYRIIGRLGAGGMGTVHAGLDADGSRVAVKVVHAVFAEDAEFRARFRREVELSSRVTGPWLVPVLAADPDADAPWLATAYVAGLTLHEHLARFGPLTGGTLYAFAAGTAHALAAVHRSGVMHRDVKPQNVILAPGGPRMLDFGIAHAAEGTAVTRTGVVSGTPGWISPEHYRTGASGFEGDVFAWGALVAHAATGRLVFGTGAPDAIAYRVMSERPDLEGVPADLREVVEQALAKRPEERISAADAAEAATRLLAGQVTTVLPPGTVLEPTRVGELVCSEWGVPPLDDPAWRLLSRSRSRVLLAVLAAVIVVAGERACRPCFGQPVPPMRQSRGLPRHHLNPPWHPLWCRRIHPPLPRPRRRRWIAVPPDLHRIHWPEWTVPPSPGTTTDLNLTPKNGGTAPPRAPGPRRTPPGQCSTW